MTGRAREPGGRSAALQHARILGAVPASPGPVQLRDGLPPVVTTPEALQAAVATFAAGTGPTGVDAERASGYRYDQRAFLVQLRRAGAGTALIDPVACPDLTALNEVLAGSEFVLHAASQDLPCLAELGFRPRRLFDTELAARLLGYRKVGLGALVQTVLGLEMEKGHAGVDWSTRPLPESWLRYAALDVEMLVELRDALETELRAAGKLGWAREEFASIAAAPLPAAPAEPWRRTSGIHRVASRRGLAAVRALWHARDRIARHRDLCPARVLADKTIVEASIALPCSSGELRKLRGFRTDPARRHMRAWSSAIARARHQPASDLPTPADPQDGPPPSRWKSCDAAAAERLTAARAAVAEIAEAHGIPPENLLAPGTVKHVAWNPPEPLTPEAIAHAVRARGARAWQVGLTASALAGALGEP